MEVKNLIIFAFLVASVDLKIPPYFQRKLALQESGFILESSSYEAQASEGDGYRLPNNTRPLSYDVHLTTHIHAENFTFSGHVTIKFEVIDNPLNKITIHMKSLKNLKIDLLNSSSNVIQNDVNYTHAEKFDFLIIIPNRFLTLNETYILDITYDGELRDDNLGFYKSYYINDKNETKWLATTQFESVEARSAFPCYDEPQIRAPFKISITHHANFTALSNMPEESTSGQDKQGYVTTSYFKSPEIQTYLIAFIISDFKSVDGPSPGVPQRVFAKSSSIDAGEADIALKYGIELLEKFEEYLGINYFTSKLDQVAIPDFDAGAMENFGLVTYREEYLLHDSKIDTTQQKENVLTIISHEYAHQWFGDLVSPEWWNYLWLNEGFATLYEYHLVSLVYDSDRLMDSFLVNILQPALEYDGNDVRAMTHYVETPDEIGDLFDTIAYEKAGSVLRMIQNAIGDDLWRRGLKNYLVDRNLSAAEPQNLHDALQKALDEANLKHLNITDIMLSWETQAGYPVINVSLTNEQITFKQSRFLYDNSESEMLWYVPVNFVTASHPVVINTKPDLWMDKVASKSLKREESMRNWNENDWIIVNLQQGYYYRVNYDDNLWKAIIKQLDENRSQIDLRNRGQLIDDSLNLARAGKLSYDIPLSLLKHLKEETDYLPWAAAYGELLLLNRWLNGLNMHEKYQKFVRQLVEPFYKHVGFDIRKNEHKFLRYSRRIAINLACQFGHEECLKSTKDKLTDEEIHPDMLEPIYANGLRDADNTTYKEMIEEMLNSKYQAHRTLMIRALAYTQKEENLKQLLMLTIDESEKRIRTQEKSRIYRSWPNAGSVGVKAVIEFIRENHEKISHSDVKSMVSTSASYVSSDDLRTKFSEFLEFLKEKEIVNDSEIISYMTKVNATKIWQDKNVEIIEKWLDANGAKSIAISTVFVLIVSALIKIFF